MKEQLLLKQQQLYLLTGLDASLARVRSLDELENVMKEHIAPAMKEQQSSIADLQQVLDKALLQADEDVQDKLPNLIGTSPAMQRVTTLVQQVAQSGSTVVILGETGTGKELVAQAIHQLSSRAHQPMIKLNCAALPASLIESELFGHERGAFTGASEKRTGKFELAQHGTLFLDEIGELPLDLQAKLLRALQEREIERVGGNKVIKVDVRIIAATNRELDADVRAGKFRSDLYYRLNVFPIGLPPLRQRTEDIPLLLQYFMQHYALKNGRGVKSISKQAEADAMAYGWPGNIRELQHLVERAVLLSNSTVLSDLQLPVAKEKSITGGRNKSFIRTLSEMEREYILQVIKKCNGKISGKNGASEKLGLPATTLVSKMKKLGIRRTHYLEKTD